MKFALILKPLCLQAIDFFLLSSFCLCELFLFVCSFLLRLQDALACFS